MLLGYRRRLWLMPLVKVTAQLRHGLEPDGDGPELLTQLLQLLLQHGTLSACAQSQVHELSCPSLYLIA